jgi:phytoene desaturase
VFYPQGGIYEVPQALYKIALEEGVKFEFGTEVEKIVVESGEVKGVQISNNLVLADIIISNADMRHTETKLLDSTYQTYPQSYWEKQVISPSGFIMYL